MTGPDHRLVLRTAAMATDRPGRTTTIPDGPPDYSYPPPHRFPPDRHRDRTIITRSSGSYDRPDHAHPPSFSVPCFHSRAGTPIPRSMFPLPYTPYLTF
jgi:hypothetical protein